jgi:hypothetical protein
MVDRFLLYHPWCAAYSHSLPWALFPMLPPARLSHHPGAQTLCIFITPTIFFSLSAALPHIKPHFSLSLIWRPQTFPATLSFSLDLSFFHAVIESVQFGWTLKEKREIKSRDLTQIKVYFCSICSLYSSLFAWIIKVSIHVKRLKVYAKKWGRV